MNEHDKRLLEFQKALIERDGLHPDHARRVAELSLAGHTTQAFRLARREVCGAYLSRRGRICLGPPVAPGRRCRFHGGLSTSYRTPEGKQHVSEAIKRYWREWRALPANLRPSKKHSAETRERIGQGVRAYLERRRAAEAEQAERERIRQAAEELPDFLK